MFPVEQPAPAIGSVPPNGRRGVSQDLGRLAVAIHERQLPDDVVWTYSQTGSTAIIHPRGELDMYVVECVGASIREAAASAPLVVVIDLSGVTFMDSSALGLLVRLSQETEARGQRMLLARVPSIVARLFEVAGVSNRFEYVPKTGPRLCPICDGDLAAGAKYGCPHCGARLE